MIQLYNKTKHTKYISYCNHIAIDTPSKEYIDYPLPFGHFKNVQTNYSLIPLKVPQGLAYAMTVIYGGGLHEDTVS